MENVPAKHAQRFDEIKELNLETSRAWAIKEVFRNFWLCDTVKKAGRYFGQWYVGWDPVLTSQRDLLLARVFGVASPPRV